MMHIRSYILPLIVMGGVAIVGGILFFGEVKAINKPPKPALSLLHTTPDSSSHSLHPVISNQWYSTILSHFPSDPVYAFPLAFQFSEEGMGFSYPDVVRGPQTISAEYQKDFVVGLPHKMSQPTLESVGDWHIQGVMQTNNAESLSFTVGHGLPFATLTAKSSLLTISLANTASIYNNNTEQISSHSFQTRGFTISTNQHFYGVFFDKNVSVSYTSNALTIQNPNKIVIALLDKREHYQDFSSLMDVNITDTQSFFSLDGDKLSTTYQIMTNGKDPLIVLFPHQYNNLATKYDILGEYQSIRGPLELIRTKSFTTSLPLLAPNGTFDTVSTNSAEITTQLKKDIAGALQEPPPNSKDYFLGKWFGKMSTLLLLADTFNLEDEKNKLLLYVEPLFLKSLSNFSYDSKKTSVIAKYPEFGNENLNDHHFHYGYYIRTAAVLSNFDTTLVQKVKAPITDMVNDIATTQRESSNFPYLRTFDVYEGHSWADGFGNTADGNNQESTSEAINAWYGVYLWSKVVNDSQLESYALYLYNTEIQSAQYYWFDKGSVYGLPYRHSIASMMWGGKVDFATWFSNETNMKYGIQLLPITPASVYLGTLPHFAQYEKDFLASGGNERSSWGDLFSIWKSFYKPNEVFSQRNLNYSLEDSNTKSLFLYMLSLNKGNQDEKKTTPTP